jgi:negative regulator of sigma E activity
MSFVKHLLAALVLLFFGNVGAAAASPHTAETSISDRATRLLRESIEAPRIVSYIGQLQTVRFAGNDATATLVRVEHKAPLLTRRWFLAPEALYGDYLITRGAQTYRFETKRARMVVSENPAMEDDAFTHDHLDLMSRNYRPVLDGAETVANRPTVALLLINKYTGERAIRIWIDKETHLILRKEEFHGNGAVASQARFEAIRYTTNIPEDIFSVTSPGKFTRVEGITAQIPSPKLDELIREIGFAPYKPRDLPQGFALIGGSVTTVKGVKTLHLTYTDGLRTLSLFENNKGATVDFGALPTQTTRFENHEARWIEDGPTTLLTWEEHGLYFALVGDSSRNELARIAQSVVP